MNVALNIEKSLPRIFAAGLHADLQRHMETFGPLPRMNKTDWLEQIRCSELMGRGGAGFSTFHKIASSEHSGEVTVIANGAEGENLSYKDRMLLEHAPHLVMDGLRIVGALLDAQHLVLYAREESLRFLAEPLTRSGMEPLLAPGTYISGESTAAARAYLQGIAKPMNNVLHLNHSEELEPSFFGLRRRTRGPILVQNVETLAQIALIIRYGAEWFNFASESGRGTRLFTVHNRLRNQVQVLELPDGSSTASILRAANMEYGVSSTVLVGGFSGRWVNKTAMASPVSDKTQVGYENSVVEAGTGVIYPLLPGENPLDITASMLNYLASQTAEQCGPCVNGLPALSQAFGGAIHNVPGAREELMRLGSVIRGRGMCKHPDATAKFALTTVKQFLPSSAQYFHTNSGSMTPVQ